VVSVSSVWYIKQVIYHRKYVVHFYHHITLWNSNIHVIGFAYSLHTSQLDESLLIWKHYRQQLNYLLNTLA